MKAKIKRVEEGVVLVADQPLFDQLGFDDGAEVELSSNAGAVVMTPIQDPERARRFRESAAKVTEKHAGLFERLSK